MRNKMWMTLAALLVTGSAIAADDRGSMKDAEGMVKKAVEAFKKEGKDKAFTAINDPKGPFVVKDIYVYATDMKGNVQAHGVNKGLVGKDMSQLKDTNGKPFVQNLLEAAKSKSSMYEEYVWTDPISKKVAPKKVYCEKADEFIFCSGAYIQ